MDDNVKRPHDTHATRNHDSEMLPGSHASWVFWYGELLGYPVWPRTLRVYPFLAIALKTTLLWAIWVPIYIKRGMPIVLLV